MTIITDPVVQILCDFYAACYETSHERTELIDYKEWADKIYAITALKSNMTTKEVIEMKWESFKFHELPLPIGAITPQANESIKSFISSLCLKVAKAEREEVLGEFKKIIGNIRRFDDKEEGADYFAGWDNAVDIITLDFNEALKSKLK